MFYVYDAKIVGSVEVQCRHYPEHKAHAIQFLGENMSEVVKAIKIYSPLLINSVWYSENGFDISFADQPAPYGVVPTLEEGYWFLWWKKDLQKDPLDTGFTISKAHHFDKHWKIITPAAEAR
jgi:hypothetical protein